MPRLWTDQQDTMEKLDEILKDYVAQGDVTKDKILGVTFIIQNKHGESSPP